MNRLADPERARPRRPIPVTVLAVFQLVQAMVYAAGLVSVLVDPAGLEVGVASVTFASGVLIVATVQVISAVGLLMLRRFGWTVAMLVTGISLAGQLTAWWNDGTLIPIAMLLAVLTVLYLNQAPVRAAFGMTRGNEVQDVTADRA